MTLPVWGNSLSLSQIQTEFGGSNPASLNEYYAGGGLVPAGTVGYPSGGSAVAIPTSGTISINNFFGASALTIINPMGFNGGSVDDITSAGDNSVADLYINSDGTYLALGSHIGTVYSGNWITPTTAGVGSGYYVKFTRNSLSGFGTYGGTATTGWLSLSSQRAIQVYANAPLSSYGIANYTVQISTSATGTPVVTSASIVLEATSASGGGGGGGL